MNMQGLFKEVQQFYLSLKIPQNTRILMCSKLMALLRWYMYTTSPQVQQTLETFLKIILTSLSC